MKKISDNYKEELFYLWYNNGKPGSRKLWQMIPSDFELRYPDLDVSLSSVNNWINGDFRERGRELDEESKRQVNNIIVADKVAMLSRHAKIGERMQTIAVEFLEENKDKLSLPTAVRLLVEGVRIERDSVGLPDALKKYHEMTDDELLDEVKQIFADSPIKILDSGFSDEEI